MARKRMHDSPTPRSAIVHLAVAASALCMTQVLGCATARKPPLEPLDHRVDLSRFMGRWYVLAHIPIDNLLASEADAYNAVEEYALREDGSIATTFTFREGAFDGPPKRFEPTGFVHDESTNAEWRMQFVWPFKSAYLIVYLDESYDKTIIGVPDRSHVWIMARTPRLPADEYRALIAEVERLGYDPAALREVPQRW